MLKEVTYFFIVVFLHVDLSFAQDIKVFTLDDFDLRGDVKTCQVITDYGQEIFEFDVLGRLVKSTTEYNQEDKDITTYIFDRDALIEKRVESYKNNMLDFSSSLAHFYKTDYTDVKIIKEQIISYDKEFVELQEYQYDENGQLIKIITSHEDAVDEVEITATDYKNEQTKTFFENGVIQKSIRESVKKGKGNGNLKVVLTKTYLDGEPSQAVEEQWDAKKNLVSKELFVYSIAESKFISKEKNFYLYDNEDVLAKEIIQLGNVKMEKEYIFQFDANLKKNWVKKIITPENTFTTRKITYYPKTLVELQPEDKP